MQIISQGVAHASIPKSDAASCCFPSICALPSGRWIAGARIGPAKLSRMQRAAFRYSDDQGNSWSPLVLPLPDYFTLAGHVGTFRALACTSLGGSDIVLTLAWEDYSNPLLPMFNEATEGLVDMKLFLLFSTDEGKTFGAIKPVNCGVFASEPTPITGPALHLPDGNIAVQFEVNKHYNDNTPWQHKSAVVITPDRGATWSKAFITHTDPKRQVFCWDQRIAVMPDGKLADYYWTYDMGPAKYQNIHVSFSHDNGQTWSAAKPTNLPGQPGRPVGLSDGRTVLVFVNRDGEPSIRARISHDGVNFDPQSELLIHQRSIHTQTVKKGSMNDAWAEMSKFSVGLPDVCPLPNNELLLVYYTGDHADYTDINWARIKP